MSRDGQAARHELLSSARNNTQRLHRPRRGSIVTDVMPTTAVMTDERRAAADRRTICVELRENQRYRCVNPNEYVFEDFWVTSVGDIACIIETHGEGNYTIAKHVLTRAIQRRDFILLD